MERLPELVLKEYSEALMLLEKWGR